MCAYDRFGVDVSCVSCVVYVREASMVAREAGQRLMEEMASVLCKASVVAMEAEQCAVVVVVVASQWRQ